VETRRAVADAQIARHSLIMASVGHLAVGLLAGRLHGGAEASPRARPSTATLLAFAALAALPDLDVVVVALGAPDVGAAGHRGASHSIAVALTLGLLGALVARRFGWPFARTALVATLALASHGILDAFGEGGRGIPLLWPLTDARFMSPWRLLPDAPRGLAMLSHRGLDDVAAELFIFLPFTAAALWPTRAPVIRLTAHPAQALVVLDETASSFPNLSNEPSSPASLGNRARPRVRPLGFRRRLHRLGKRRRSGTGVRGRPPPSLQWLRGQQLRGRARRRRRGSFRRRGHLGDGRRRGNG